MVDGWRHVVCVVGWMGRGQLKGTQGGVTEEEETTHSESFAFQAILHFLGSIVYVRDNPDLVYIIFFFAFLWDFMLVLSSSLELTDMNGEVGIGEKFPMPQFVDFL